MNIALVPDAVMAAAKKNDAHTADARTAAHDAVTALVSLTSRPAFGTSPAGQSTGPATAPGSDPNRTGTPS